MRKFVTEAEFAAMLAATTGQRHAARDRLLLLCLYRHGLRVSEARALRLWSVDLAAGTLFVERLKGGLSGLHPLGDDVARALEACIDQGLVTPPSGPLFVSERGTVLSRQQIHYLCRRYGQLAGVAVPVHPHMLRHGCGHALAERGKDTRLIQVYLGHASIQSTTIYTELSARRMRSIWSAEIGG